MPYKDKENRRLATARWRADELVAETQRERVRQWRRRNPGYGCTRQKAIRAEVIAHYGARCACCGETEPMFLTLDHINGGGKRQREELGGSMGMYLWTKRAGFPDDLQILCWNCNSGRYRNGGICPHKRQE